MFKYIQQLKFNTQTVKLVAFVVGLLFAGVASAATDPTIKSIASNINTSVSSLATILSDISLIAGIGFVMASFFKFHQHKLNPTQIPLSHGLTLILIGGGLLLFPSLLSTVSSAVFGSASISTIGGSGIHGIIGK